MDKPLKSSFRQQSEKRLIALLVAVPKDDDDGMRRLRSLLKAMLRNWGIRCVAARPPKETKTFGSSE